MPALSAVVVAAVEVGETVAVFDASAAASCIAKEALERRRARMRGEPGLLLPPGACLVSLDANVTGSVWVDFS